MKVCIIGGTSGIGLALAKQLQLEGYEVHVASRSKTNRSQVSRYFLAESIHYCDATNSNDITQLFETLASFDHLICTQKHQHAFQLVNGISVASAQDAFNQKFWSQFMCATLAIHYLNLGGSITLTAGVASQKAYAGYAITGAINGAVESFVRGLASEYKNRFRINAVSPGFIERFKNDSERLCFARGIDSSIRSLISQESIIKVYHNLIISPNITGQVEYINNDSELF